MGELVLTHQDTQDFFVGFVLLFVGAGVGVILAPLFTGSSMGAVLLVLVLVSAAAAVWWVRNRLRPHVVLYVFHGGLVLEQSDGQVLLYPWTEVRMSTRRSHDMPPWGTGQIFLQLSGDDGRHLGTLVGADKHQIIQTLRSGSSASGEGLTGPGR